MFDVPGAMYGLLLLGASGTIAAIYLVVRLNSRR